jgi:hypothetical protein
MKDEDRLNLLKEVAGTTVYEERRSESLRIMQETSTKQEQITVRVSQIKGVWVLTSHSNKFDVVSKYISFCNIITDEEIPFVCCCRRC